MKRFVLCLLIMLACVLALLPAALAEGRIVFEEPEVTLTVGGDNRTVMPVKEDIDATIRYKWSSDDPKIAKVSAKGTVYPVSGGETTIRCTGTAKDGTEYKAEYKVLVVQISKKIAADVTDIKLASAPWTPGDEIADYRYCSYTPVITFTPENTTNKGLIWTTEDPAVATVDESGKITAHNSGETVVTAEAADGSGAALSINVTVPVCFLIEESVTLTSPEPVLLGQTFCVTNGVNVTDITTEGDVFTVETSHRMDGLTWFRLSPVKFGTGKINFVMNGETVGVVDVRVEHSAVYDDESYPPRKVSTLLKKQKSYTGKPVQMNATLIDTIEKNGVTMGAATTTEGKKTYYVLFELPASGELPAAGTSVNLFGTVSGFDTINDPNGKAVDCPVLGSVVLK